MSLKRLRAMTASTPGFSLGPCVAMVSSHSSFIACFATGRHDASVASAHTTCTCKHCNIVSITVACLLEIEIY